MQLEGIHHVTCITGDAPGNLAFYTNVLGLRLVKKTVNQDDPTVYHLFYADEEGSAGENGQIAEFLRAYNGEGIQHIAFASDDIYAALDGLAERGLEFAPPPPDAYYDLLGSRLPGHGEPVEELKKRSILVDGTIEGGRPRLLMQIFSRLMVGPIFFEFIQRKGDEGFGEGNIEALFRSMEEDQKQREQGGA